MEKAKKDLRASDRADSENKKSGSRKPLCSKTLQRDEIIKKSVRRFISEMLAA